MRTIEKKGKTVDEAIWSGLQELQLTRDRVRVEIIEPGSKGFLGLGAKAAEVRLTEVEPEEKISFADLLKTDLNLSLKADAEKAKEPLRETKAQPKVQEQKPAAAPAVANKPVGKQLSEEKSNPRPAGTSEAQMRSASPGRNNRPEYSDRQSDRIRGNYGGRHDGSEKYSRQNFAEAKQISETEDEVWPIPTEEAPARAYKFAGEMIQAMQLKCRVDVRAEEDSIVVNLSGDADDLGILIGKRGNTLDAFQYLLTVVVNRGREEHQRITLNVGDYRKRREETLIRLAKRLAKEVEMTEKAISLEPMSARERRLIHMALQDSETVYTESAGEDSRRHVVIYKK
ncbi:MAG: Jag N-terminal domain-containing protein [Negativicutes bacterium]|nr:Jag N-terminal domain-containing protein [Negativicutes bacterium]